MILADALISATGTSARLADLRYCETSLPGSVTATASHFTTLLHPGPGEASRNNCLTLGVDSLCIVLVARDAHRYTPDGCLTVWSSPAAMRLQDNGVRRKLNEHQEFCGTCRAGDAHDTYVGRRGLEPRTYGLKVRSSTIELATRQGHSTRGQRAGIGEPQRLVTALTGGHSA